MLYINAGIYFLMALMIFPRNPPGRSPGVSPVAQQQQLADTLQALGILSRKINVTDIVWRNPGMR